ncbi:NOP58 family protein [Candidatus Micrarchaeota archaeon]|nr:NOP58 family protein [Candidatus Micrarchaeota archaeon]
MSDIKKFILGRIKEAKDKTREGLSSIDNSIVQAVSSLDEYNDIINRVYERLFTWYDFYFPELKNELTIQEYANFAKEYDFVSDPKMEYLSDSKKKKVNVLFKNRIGSDPTPESLYIVRLIAYDLFVLYKTKNEIETFIEKNTQNIAPNMCSIAPALVVARLIKHANGLRKLAMEPSSTIQVFGSEKALFKHLKTGADSPKHGVIYQIPDISKASKETRGKVSRLYANQLSIAAKADVFTGNDISEKLKYEIKKRLKEIEEHAKNPKKKKHLPAAKPSYEKDSFKTQRFQKPDRSQKFQKPDSKDKYKSEKSYKPKDTSGPRDKRDEYKPKNISHQKFESEKKVSNKYGKTKYKPKESTGKPKQSSFKDNVVSKRKGKTSRDKNFRKRRR